MNFLFAPRETVLKRCISEISREILEMTGKGNPSLTIYAAMVNENEPIHSIIFKAGKYTRGSAHIMRNLYTT